MAFDHLRPRPATRITTAWGHSLVDALNLLYGWLTSGQYDVFVNALYGIYGFFDGQVLVQGRPVLKDGDPITIYDIYDLARTQITAAVDAARATSRLDLLYGKFYGMFMDTYGRVGVAIYDDRVGLAKDSTVAAVRDRLPSALSAAGNLRVAVYEDTVGLARDSTVAAVRDRMDTLIGYGGRQSTTLDLIYGRFNRVLLDEYGRVGVAIYDDRVGVARDSTLSSILTRLDVNLATRASESTLAGIKAQTDRLSFDASNRLAVQNPPNLDVALSTRASESTLAGIKAQTDRLSFDDAGRLIVSAETVTNPSNLDVALSTRASEGTLSSFSGKFPSPVTLSDSLPNPSTTIIGSANLGWDGAYWRRISVDTGGRLAVQNPPNLDVALSSRASESTLLQVRDRLPSSLSDAGNLRVAVQEDAAGLAREATLQSILSRMDVSLSTRASESTLSSLYSLMDGLRTSSGNLRIALVETTIKQPVDVQDHLVESVVLLSSAARTSSGTGSDVDVGRFICAEICIDVTAVSGTSPVLNVYVEGRSQATGKYKVIASQTGINAVGTWWFTIPTLAFRFLRVRWEISGTSPSFTFSVSGEFKS